MGGNFVIEKAWRDPAVAGSVHADVRIGGHLEHVHAIYSDPMQPLCQIEAMGLLISIHRPSMRAVVNTLHRVYKEDAIEFPFDLYPSVASVEPAFPYLPPTPERLARLSHECDEKGIACTALHAVADVLALYDAELTVRGRAITVRVSMFVGAGKTPVVLWRGSAQPEELTRLSRDDRAAAEWAMIHALPSMSG